MSWVDECRHPNAAEIEAASVAAPRNRWIIAGTDASRPYPCRCNERPAWAKDCSPAWCPCAGRRDRENVPASCCSWRYGPADHVRAMEEWRAEKARREAQEREG